MYNIETKIVERLGKKDNSHVLTWRVSSQYSRHRSQDFDRYQATNRTTPNIKLQMQCSFKLEHSLSDVYEHSVMYTKINLKQIFFSLPLY